MMHEVLTRRLKAFLDGDEKFQKLPDLVMIDGGKGQLTAALKARDELGLTMPMIGLAKRHELIYVPIASEGELLEDMRQMQATIAANKRGNQDKVDDEYSYARAAPRLNSYREVELPLNSPGLALLRRLRDEAHRFALTYHRKLRDKKFGGSSLDEIPGVGPRRKRLLLRTFGSVEGIRRATVDELASIPTMTKALAEKVREFLTEV
jgi:excinuclease ABC subunit C